MKEFQPLVLDRNGIAHKEEAIKKKDPYITLFDDLGNQVYVARIETHKMLIVCFFTATMSRLTLLLTESNQ